ncbi:Flagellar assembly factor FliW [Novipirellula galeiformis]|uniref:Flagellar assembly factor FliW n=1 Tax=Novipirellula galeiformis TaxID=2528004 RepID=A0A5C6CIP1_9BACT|nr:flagellar assembly protein FliW [Novipirellula galeiformis]TWU23985.1 Flagellar assembly factor FliW [Novipirellula galeiformis]
MRIDTNRFGTLQINADELFLFPQGLIGMETLRQWALLPDPESPSVAWLQSVSRSDRAIPLVSPRAFFPDYRIHLRRRELSGLHLRSDSEMYVMTTVSGREGNMTTNLRAPILLNLLHRLGCQVIADNELPIQQSLSIAHATIGASASPLRQAA